MSSGGGDGQKITPGRQYKQECEVLDKEIAAQEERVNRAKAEKDLAEKGSH